jgi:sulfate transport system substrate-binding protein
MAMYLKRALLLIVLMLAGCGSSGSSNPNAPTSEAVEIINASYDPTRELYQEINNAFAAEQAKAGTKVRITQSHGGSGAQARAVIDGLKADVVTLALEGDIDAIAKKGLIQADWIKRLRDGSAPYTSTIVLVVRAGNPKGIKDWDDLIRPDVKIITPNPKTSGGARYNFLAAWGFAAKQKKGSESDAKEFVRKLYKNVQRLDTGARGSTQTFVKNKLGDVLIAWENDAILAQKEVPDQKLQIIYPSISILAEPPVAVVDKNVDERGTRAVAEAYLKFLYSDSAQDIIGKNSYRPRNPVFLKKYADHLPALPLFTVAEVAGSWAEAQQRFFADGGVFDEIYRPQ